ncbi:transcriptional regulator [Actinoplanes sp. TBRC 11911]|uniref:BTAD domain-containing putative transcriptional regulator n=1 Tax=Actinoplanes sp. TBRC 11911 TaxID=2729386 RepID=UPI00145E1156|nr:BTAD domain-containing putative transcriptional regulator [Actinoplanes sp. TBRC 11911]NMO55548.1 transcriptional regulator [Actinoplanes sp. TBRC 11911]
MIDGRAAALRFEILGDVRVQRGERTVDLGPAKQRAVLAVLLLQAGRPVPTHQIVDGVWGDEPPENGANVVQKYVAGLRRVLDPDRAPRTPGELLALTGGGYVLRTSGATLDADEFRDAGAQAGALRADGLLAEAAATLRAGLALWRGAALAGLTGPIFEAARTRLAESHATAWETWAEIELERGQSAELIPDLSRLVDEFPLREGLRAELMLALHRAGRQAEALAAFRDAREYFLDEFGVEPGEKMQVAHRQILRGEVPAPAGQALPVAAPASSAAGQAPPFATPVSPAAGQAPPAAAPAGPVPLPYGYQPPTPTGWPATPAPPVPAPPKHRIPVVQVLLAAVIPIFSLGFLGWIYFVILAIRQGDKRQYLVAAGYAATGTIGFVLIAMDPAPDDSGDFASTGNPGVVLCILTLLASAIHGVVMATHLSTTGRNRRGVHREHALQIAAHDPALARQMGIGRPDLPRAFHGGLIDINHMDGAGLARYTRLGRAAAQRIVADRYQRGPFRSPDDLVARGLITAGRMRRLRPRLIAVPPAQVAGPPPWVPPQP